MNRHSIQYTSGSQTSSSPSSELDQTDLFMDAVDDITPVQDDLIVTKIQNVTSKLSTVVDLETQLQETTRVLHLALSNKFIQALEICSLK